MSDRQLTTRMKVLDQEVCAFVSFPAGTWESEIPERLRASLTNPAIWSEPDHHHKKDEGLGHDPVSADPGYELLTVPKLIELARQRNIRLSSARKNDIIKALKDHDGEDDDSDE